MAVQPSLCGTWPETLNTFFFMMQLISDNINRTLQTEIDGANVFCQNQSHHCVFSNHNVFSIPVISTENSSNIFLKIPKDFLDLSFIIT